MIIFGILSLSLDIQKLMNVVPNFITFISLFYHESERISGIVQENCKEFQR